MVLSLSAVSNANAFSTHFRRCTRSRIEHRSRSRSLARLVDLIASLRRYRRPRRSWLLPPVSVLGSPSVCPALVRTDVFTRCIVPSRCRIIYIPGYLGRTPRPFAASFPLSSPWAAVSPGTSTRAASRFKANKRISRSEFAH